METAYLKGKLTRFIRAVIAARNPFETLYKMSAVLHLSKAAYLDLNLSKAACLDLKSATHTFNLPFGRVVVHMTALTGAVLHETLLPSTEA